MRSSTSSSESATPERVVPGRGWGATWLASCLLVALGVGAWEALWRSRGYGADYANSDELWAIERRKAPAGDGRATVIIGSSRVFFDIDLGTWAEVVGGPPPIQLALEGTPPWASLDDLAADQRFRGFLVIGYTPGLFFGGFPGEHATLAHDWRSQTPSERFGQRVAMLLEPRLAFLDGDAALEARIKSLAWPPRVGMPPGFPEVPRLGELGRDRQFSMWSKVEQDEAYRDRVRGVWHVFVNAPFPPPTEEQIAQRIEATVAAVAAIRARGGQVLFVRCPSAGFFLDNELASRPRERFWEPLLAATGAPGIAFEDHPELQGFELPEFSHLAAAHRAPFTRALATLAKPLVDDWRDEVGESPPPP